MALVDVVEWSPEHVAEWLRGLDESVLQHTDSFLNSRINGSKLLMMTATDLNLLNLKKVGTQELILDAVNLLRELNYNIATETLQVLALKLSCEARCLYNHLCQDESSPRATSSSTSINDRNYFDFTKVDSASQLSCIKPGEQRVSLETLSSVSSILASVKSFIYWLDRYPFVGIPLYSSIRSEILRLSIEVASTAQRDQFVEQPNDVLKVKAQRLSNQCDVIVRNIEDSLIIQPTYLDVVNVKKKPDEEYGIVLRSLFFGVHLIEQVIFQSPSHRSGRICEGDEIVQVDYQTVVGWTITNVMEFIKRFSSEVILTIRKRPTHSNILSQISIIKPYKIQLRKIQSVIISVDQDTIHTDTDSFRSSDLDRPLNLDRKQSTLDCDDGSIKDVDIAIELPKEPKGPVYELNTSSTGRTKKGQLKRRASISGSIVSVSDLSQDSLTIPPIAAPNRTLITKNSSPTSSLSNNSKDCLIKSVSNDPTRLYLHTLSIDRCHLRSDDRHMKDNQVNDNCLRNNHHISSNQRSVSNDENNHRELSKQKNTNGGTFIYPEIEPLKHSPATDPPDEPKK